MNEMSALFDAVVFRLGWMLVHSIWQAALVALLLAIVLRAGRKNLSSPVRYAASYAALLIIASAGATTTMVVRPPTDLVRSHRTTGAIRITDAPIDVSPSILASTLVHPQTPAQPWNPENALPWLVGAWAVGVIVLSVWQLGGWMILQRWRHSAKAVEADLQQRVDQLAWKMAVRRVVLKLSGHVDVPIVIGIWRPVVLAPMSILTDLSPSQLEAILAHELAHVRRLDYVANLIHVAIETLLFYHPAIWWISRQIRLERECCCDELAASACADRTEYVRALTAMEQTRGPRLAPAMTGRGGRGELLARVRRLLDVPHCSTRTGIFEFRSCATSALLILVSLGVIGSSKMLRGQQQSPTPPSQLPGTIIDPDPAGLELLKRAAAIDSQQVASSVQPADLVAGPVEDYRIEPNDLLQVSIGDLPAEGKAWQKPARVSETGNISLPFLAQVKAAGLTEAQLEEAIVLAYRNKQLLTNAQVIVSITEARGRICIVMGAVAKSGQYQMMDSRMTLFDALALAGGATKEASIRVLRQSPDGSTTRKIDIPASAISSGDPKFNIIIRPRDVIIAAAPEVKVVAASNSLLEQETKILLEQLIQARIATREAEITFGPGHAKVVQAQQKEAMLQKMLDEAQQRTEKANNPAVAMATDVRPQRGEYYIGGESIKRDGVYSLTGREVTLRAAVIAAGAPTNDLLEQIPIYVTIIRRSNNQQQAILHDALLKEIMDLKQPDILLMPGDQITVTGHQNPALPTTLPAMR